ncbi:MAG: lipopolysaccharide biosynthesis protein [Odoribacter splanchnicus]
MSSENTRRIAKNTAMLYIRMLLIMAVTLYTSRIVLDVLGVEDFGIYNVVGGIVVMFSFLNGAMSQSTQRFLAFEIGRGDFQRLQQVFSVSVSIHIGIALFIFLLAETLGLWFLNTRMNIPAPRMEAARWIYQFAVFSFMVNVIQVPYNAAIIARERMHVYAYISIVEVALKLFIVFALTWVSFDKLKLYAILVFGVNVVVAFIYRIYCKLRLRECDYRFFRDWALYKTLTGFAGWSLFGSIAWLFKAQGLNIILNVFFGPILNAAYGIASQVNTAVNSFVQNFSTAVNPQLVKSYAARDLEYTVNLLFRGARFSNYLFLFFAVPLLIETDTILKIWLKTVPDYAVIFTRLVIVNSLFESFTYTMGAAIQATGKIKWYQIIVGCTILLNLPLAYLFLRLGYTPPVVLVISIIISVVTLFQRLALLRHFYRFPFFSFVAQVFLKSGLITIVSCMIPLGLKLYMAEGWVKLVCVIGTSLLTVLLLVFLLGLDRQEKNYFLNVLKQRFIGRK